MWERKENRKKILLEIINYLGDLEDENQLANILYIAQTKKYIEHLYDFRIENVYLPYSKDLHNDILELVEEGYLKKSSLILVKKENSYRTQNNNIKIKPEIRKIKKISPEDLNNLAQLTYLYVQKRIPKRELLRISPTVAMRGISKTRSLLKKLDTLR